MSDIKTRLPAYAVVTTAEAQRYAEDTHNGDYALSAAEIWWRDRYSFLETRGYALRPRYRPGWSPSWIGTNLEPMFCEDSVMLLYYHVIDATRNRDGYRVAIKRVSRNSGEIALARFLTSPERLRDPINHCVPLLDVFPDPHDHDISLMITPYLRPFDDPEFGAIGEVVDFIKQTLEGLKYLHIQRIAHRDCAGANIMMDGRPLYPHDHHPVRRHYSLDAIYEITPLSRIDHPVRYYFIDFDLSKQFPEGTPSDVLGKVGRDKQVPELSSVVPYDAFKVDIYALANLYDREFLQKYHGLEFLQPLIDSMKSLEPARRPTAQGAMSMFEHICSQLNSPFLRWRLRSRSESTSERVVYDTVAVAREGIYHLKRLIN